ncbi:hypothetical protein [Bradyrhizobium sp. BRP19]|uniref:hypothetical protein n=1 Tax=Bradyrhizobium sp. BRP19 TaxID=2793823 RepID=UPI001CD1A68F|nr:hypothetical protein [Bradyrhizobium sp. BRP19]
MRVGGEANAQIKFVIKQAAVWQASQWIVSRQIADFSFCDGSCFSSAGEFSVAPNTKDREPNAQQECNEHDEDNVVEYRLHIALSQLR